jgi:hypothetical protein
MYSRFSVQNVKTLSKMDKKTSAVSATAALTGADPFGSFLATLPRTSTVLGSKGYRTAGKKEIYITYSENGNIYHASCAFEVGKEVKADIQVVSYARKGGAA